MGMLSVENVTAVYDHRGGRVVALRDLTFEVRLGETLCVLGPSGCGKSTLLHLLGGFLKPEQGTIRHDGRPVHGPDPERGIVFQRHSLFPWLTVRGNIEFGPRLRGAPKAERRAVSSCYLERTGLEGFGDSYPQELSVGMQQRVALARSFANGPQVLLMDEPFAALDAKTRMDMGGLLSRFCAESPKAVVFVTHDVEEAILLGDRILVLSARPGTIRREFVIDLPRPRVPAAAFGPAAVELRKEIFACVFIG
jgi:NitT/TauT family transport system ATP-binding protein